MLWRDTGKEIKKMKIEILSADIFDEIKALFREIFMNEPWNDDWSDDNQLTEWML